MRNCISQFFLHNLYPHIFQISNGYWMRYRNHWRNGVTFLIIYAILCLMITFLLKCAELDNPSPFSWFEHTHIHTYICVCVIIFTGKICSRVELHHRSLAVFFKIGSLNSREGILLVRNMGIIARMDSVIKRKSVHLMEIEDPSPNPRKS